MNNTRPVSFASMQMPAPVTASVSFALPTNSSPTFFGIPSVDLPAAAANIAFRCASETGGSWASRGFRSDANLTFFLSARFIDLSKKKLIESLRISTLGWKPNIGRNCNAACAVSIYIAINTRLLHVDGKCGACVKCSLLGNQVRVIDFPIDVTLLICSNNRNLFPIRARCAYHRLTRLRPHHILCHYNQHGFVVDIYMRCVSRSP